MNRHPLREFAVATALALLAPALFAQGRPSAPATRSGDYIIAVVNQEVVTAGELEQRLQKVRADAARTGMQLPPPAALRQQVLDALIDERVQITNARDSGVKVDEAELDRAVNNVALQNQMTLPQLRAKLRQEGIDYAKFRDSIRDQILVERVRERDVMARIKISEAEIDAFLAERRAAAGMSPELNIAQILITVPDGASAAVVAERRAKAEAAQARVRNGADFATVAREVSEDGNRAEGGEIGLRPADKLPDVFVATVRTLRPGEVAPQLLRSGAGFHLLKLLDRQQRNFTIQQTHARHILLRISAQLTQQAAVQRLAEIKRAIVSGEKSFEQEARENSEDGSAAQGGDLGWVAPGTFVPEFEEVINSLAPGAISDPVVSRFGVHLVQVIDRREVTLDVAQQREQARNILREQKFDAAYVDWMRDLRGRAYIEMREPPI